MLSRIAESMFWIGRYVERAEATARILDVHYHLVVQDALIDESAACAALLSVMGARSAITENITLEHINEVLGYSLEHPASIAATLFAARENARGAREAISSEMWETLNATHHALGGRVATARSLGPNTFFRYVKERAAIVGGLVESTLCRDDGYRFLVLGRALERVDMTARLLTARATVADTPGGWVTTLLCCSAHEAYLRTYRRAVDASLVAEFLLLDRSFPRSVLYSLTEADHALAELDRQQVRNAVDDEARRLLGRAAADLEYRRLDELLAELPMHLGELQHTVAAASSAVADRYFRQTRAMEWSA
ncbi:MAG: hypothetical protein QOF21_2366 [Actinomycetota bacterium]|jgi:uncharacterized alpha-E superfamily protein